MPIARPRGSVCTMGLGPLRHPWVRIAAQLVVLELIVILSTLTAARFHPNSRPVDAIAIGLAVIAAGTIVVSWRWPAAAVGIALLSVLTYHGIGYAPGPIDLALMVALFNAATPQHLWRSIGLGAAIVLGYVAVGLLTPGGISPQGLLLGPLAVLASLGLGFAVDGQRGRGSHHDVDHRYRAPASRGDRPGGLPHHPGIVDQRRAPRRASDGRGDPRLRALADRDRRQ